MVHSPAEAWEYGYGYAVRGFLRAVPGRTWFEEFPADFLDGFDAALADGRWNC